MHSFQLAGLVSGIALFFRKPAIGMQLLFVAVGIVVLLLLLLLFVDSPSFVSVYVCVILFIIDTFIMLD